MRYLLFISVLFVFNGSHSQNLDYVFKSGEDGYNCFRIPTIIKAKNGTTLAFAEGRKKSCSDTGDVDIVYKKRPYPRPGRESLADQATDEQPTSQLLLLPIPA